MDLSINIHGNNCRFTDHLSIKNIVKTIVYILDAEISSVATKMSNFKDLKLTFLFNSLR
ncbi:MAG: hypothetical protein BWY90_00617 [Deltaproteobacteria bacterium ADurb.BinA014]|nr:MAG: hypothetical protein BWY90_00617 [Deltaproteobacteria bacterium ADurb.BinA014]